MINVNNIQLMWLSSLLSRIIPNQDKSIPFEPSPHVHKQVPLLSEKTTVYACNCIESILCSSILLCVCETSHYQAATKRNTNFHSTFLYM